MARLPVGLTKGFYLIVEHFKAVSGSSRNGLSLFNKPVAKGRRDKGAKQEAMVNGLGASPFLTLARELHSRAGKELDSLTGLTGFILILSCSLEIGH